MTEEELLKSIPDYILKKYSKEILDYHQIGGFHESAEILKFIENVSKIWEINTNDATRVSITMLTIEILKRY